MYSDQSADVVETIFMGLKYILTVKSPTHIVDHHAYEENPLTCMKRILTFLFNHFHAIVIGT